MQGLSGYAARFSLLNAQQMQTKSFSPARDTAAVRALFRADAAAAVRLPLNTFAGYYMSANCQPARRQCLPVIAPAQAIVRAGERRR